MPEYELIADTQEEQAFNERFPFKPVVNELPRELYKRSSPSLNMSYEEKIESLSQPRTQEYQNWEREKIQRAAREVKPKP